VYTQRTIPSSGYIDLDGKLNKPLSKKYYELWVNGKLLTDEVTIITPTKLFMHGLTSLKNFEIIEINRDPNEFFSTNFLEVETATNGRPTQHWNFETYLDAALEGNLEDDNYTEEEQAYLLTPVWPQVDRDHSEYKNYPPNVDTDTDVMTRSGTGTILVGGLKNPQYQFSLVDFPTIEGQPIVGRNLTFSQFGYVPITDDEIIQWFNEEWAAEIADSTLNFPAHVVMNADEWYGTVARLYDEYGNRVYSLKEAAYKLYDHNLLKINTADHTIEIVGVPVSYDLD
jgi:hypothetical protein